MGKAGSETPVLPEGYTVKPASTDPRLLCIGKLDGKERWMGPQAFYVQGRPVLYVIRDVYGRAPHLTSPGYQTVDAGQHLTARIHGDARAELEAYLENNRDNMELYKNERFWDRAIHYASMRELRNPGYFMQIDLDSKLSIGLFSKAAQNATYRPIEDRIEYTSCLGGQHPTTPFAFAYGQDYADQMVAREHLESGRAPRALQELMRISEFLMGKASVRLIYEDGEEIKTPRNRKIDGLPSLLVIDRRQLRINREVFSSAYDLPAAIAYGHHRLDLDLDALHSIEELTGRAELVELEQRVREMML